MKKYIVETRGELNGDFLGDEDFETLEDAMYYARHNLDYAVNNIRTNRGIRYYVYSEEYKKTDDDEWEVIDNTYIEYLNITTDKYYDMSYDEKEKLFEEV